MNKTHQQIDSLQGFRWFSFRIIKIFWWKVIEKKVLEKFKSQKTRHKFPSLLIFYFVKFNSDLVNKRHKADGILFSILLQKVQNSPTIWQFLNFRSQLRYRYYIERGEYCVDCKPHSIFSSSAATVNQRFLLNSSTCHNFIFANQLYITLFPLYKFIVNRNSTF
jgi:hypothetical protein